MWALGPINIMVGSFVFYKLLHIRTMKFARVLVLLLMLYGLNLTA